MVIETDGDHSAEAAIQFQGSSRVTRLREHAPFACGTGACATVTAAMCEQRMAERVTVRVPGGDLVVRAGPRAFELAGAADYVFEGSTA